MGIGFGNNSLRQYASRLPRTQSGTVPEIRVIMDEGFGGLFFFFIIYDDVSSTRGKFLFL